MWKLDPHAIELLGQLGSRIGVIKENGSLETPIDLLDPLDESERVSKNFWIFLRNPVMKLKAR